MKQEKLIILINHKNKTITKLFIQILIIDYIEMTVLKLH